MRANLACNPDGPEWKLQQLRKSILKEIQILEIGVHEKCPKGARTGVPPAVTNSFLTQTERKPPDPPRFKLAGTKGKYTYCKGPHPAYNCNVVTECQERWTIVKVEKPCFHTLGSTNVPANPDTYATNVKGSITPVSPQGHHLSHPIPASEVLINIKHLVLLIPGPKPQINVKSHQPLLHQYNLHLQQIAALGLDFLMQDSYSYSVHRSHLL